MATTKSKVSRSAHMRILTIYDSTSSGNSKAELQGANFQFSFSIRIATANGQRRNALTSKENWMK
ncbi:hypothetical protein WT56_29445 [Burkholderia pseudomultivorans]|uniref:Uncharacterized protein n=1 Tax=Burkholderia pseudomultivorans TaxID=1207504 RepID=A0A132E829_9BURK|nr:hypothetical protein WT56_29445 [Burkholderia pseudomultivorans]